MTTTRSRKRSFASSDERTRKVFRIGDHVKIKVETADVEKNILHFLLARGR